MYALEKTLVMMLTNDQTGIICLLELSALFLKEVIGIETFRLLLKY